MERAVLTITRRDDIDTWLRLWAGGAGTEDNGVGSEAFSNTISCSSTAFQFERSIPGLAARDELARLSFPSPLKSPAGFPGCHLGRLTDPLGLR